MNCRSLFPSALSFPVTYAGNFGGLARPRGGQQLADLPRKDARVLSFASDYCGDDPRGEEPRPAPSDGLGCQQPRAAVAAQDLTHAPVGHLKRAIAPRSLTSNTFRHQKPNGSGKCEGVLSASWRSGSDGLPLTPVRSFSSSWIQEAVCRSETCLQAG